MAEQTTYVEYRIVCPGDGGIERRARSLDGLQAAAVEVTEDGCWRCRNYAVRPHRIERAEVTLLPLDSAS